MLSREMLLKEWLLLRRQVSPGWHPLLPEDSHPVSLMGLLSPRGWHLLLLRLLQEHLLQQSLLG